MAQMNARMGIETVFLPTSPEFSYLSSSLMKEVVTLGGDINGLVPPVVEVRLKEKLGCMRLHGSSLEALEQLITEARSVPLVVLRGDPARGGPRV